MNSTLEKKILVIKSMHSCMCDLFQWDVKRNKVYFALLFNSDMIKIMDPSLKNTTVKDDYVYWNVQACINSKTKSSNGHWVVYLVKEFVG